MDEGMVSSISFSIEAIPIKFSIFSVSSVPGPM
jgi:hypothetical protein